MCAPKQPYLPGLNMPKQIWFVTDVSVIFLFLQTLTFCNQYEYNCSHKDLSRGFFKRAPKLYSMFFQIHCQEH